MRKLILIVVLGLALGALFGQLMMSVPGYWLVRVGDTSFQTSFWFGLVILLAGFLVLHFALRLLVRLVHPVSNFKVWNGRARNRNAMKRTVRGLVALAEGRWKKAEKSLVKAADDSSTPLVNYLSAALAAHYQGRFDQADTLLKRAHLSTEGADTAVGLMQAQLHGGRHRGGPDAGPAAARPPAVRGGPGHPHPPGPPAPQPPPGAQAAQAGLPQRQRLGRPASPDAAAGRPAADLPGGARPARAARLPRADRARGPRGRRYRAGAWPLGRHAGSPARQHRADRALRRGAGARRPGAHRRAAAAPLPQGGLGQPPGAALRPARRGRRASAGHRREVAAGAAQRPGPAAHPGPPVAAQRLLGQGPGVLRGEPASAPQRRGLCRAGQALRQPGRA